MKTLAQDKRQVDAITARDVDFAQWYTDVCKKAELIDYTSVKGMFIYRPYGYALWENIQAELDRRFKATGHENVYLPVLIPESLLQKEKDHVEGFAPECAWVTVGGSEKLEDRCAIRPTSETLFCEHYANIIHSWQVPPGVDDVGIMFGDAVLRALRKDRSLLARSAEAVQPVVLGCPLGKDHPSVPAQP